MLRKFVILSVIIIGLCECTPVSNNDTRLSAIGINNSEYTDISEMSLNNPDTIAVFPNDYPVSLSVMDNAIVTIKIHSDSAIVILDKNTGMVLSNTGTIGIGPDDILSPKLLNSPSAKNGNILHMVDVNAGKMLDLDIRNGNITQSKLPDYLKGMGYINLFDSIMVASMVGNTDFLFEIYNITDNSMHTVDSPFKLSEDNINRLGSGLSIFMASNLFANNAKKSIIAPMYYFDLYNVYDFNGNLKKQVSLGAMDFDINKDINRMFMGNEYWHYSLGCATDDACWLKRVKSRADFESNKTIKLSQQLIKIAWNGTPLAVYALPDNISNFCIDGDNGLYGIVNQTNDNEEFYYILKWML